jgi:putative membrane protein
MQTLALITTTVLAHGNYPSPVPSDPWAEWDLNPLVMAGVAFKGWLYLRGARRARLYSETTATSALEYRAVAAGWCALVIALVSPLHPLGKSLFSAHVGQLQILTLVAAPLIALGRPMRACIWALPESWKPKAERAAQQPLIQKTWRVISRPLVAWILYGATLWVWHIPPVFDLTQQSSFVHALEHMTLIAASLLFWSRLVHGNPRLMSYGAAMLYLLTTALHQSVLGVLIAFAPNALYSSYAETTRSWGFSPLEDQQLGGVALWIPAATVYLVAALLADRPQQPAPQLETPKTSWQESFGAQRTNRPVEPTGL